MNMKIILGAVAGAGIAYLLTTPRGKELLGSITKQMSNGLNEGEGILSKASDIVGSFGKRATQNAYARHVPRHGAGGGVE